MQQNSGFLNFKIKEITMPVPKQPLKKSKTLLESKDYKFVKPKPLTREQVLFCSELMKDPAFRKLVDLMGFRVVEIK